MNFNSNADLRECDDIREELQPYVLSQYSASPTITTILKNFRNEIDPQADIELFYEKIMNIDTAEGVGLDIWGRILGIQRNILLLDNTTVYTLNDDRYRKLLMFKALANITNASLATLNKMLTILLGIEVIAKNRYIPGTLASGEHYNQAPMHVNFTFVENADDIDRAVVVRGIILCLGAGVGWSVSFVNDNIFGFKNSELQPFNQGVFLNGTIGV